MTSGAPCHFYGCQEMGRVSYGQNLRNSGGITSAPSTQVKGQESGKQTQSYLEQLGIDTILCFRKTLGFSHNFQAQNVYFSFFLIYTISRGS